MHVRLPMVLALTLLAPALAGAQTEGLFAVGGGITRFDPPDDDVGSSVGIGVLLRLKPKQGWGPVFGLGWYSSDVFADVEGRRVRVGHVRVRPIMAGYGYTHLAGRVALHAAALGGYSPNSARVNSSSMPRGGDRSRLDARDALVARPSVAISYSLRPRLALVASAALLLHEPGVRLTIDGRETVDRWRFHTGLLGAGVVYSLF